MLVQFGINSWGIILRPYILSSSSCKKSAISIFSIISSSLVFLTVSTKGISQQQLSQNLGYHAFLNLLSHFFCPLLKIHQKLLDKSLTLPPKIEGNWVISSTE